MEIDIKKLLKKYENIDDTYKYAYIGIPKSLGNIKKNFFGTLDEFKRKYPNFRAKKKLPLVLFMHGSAGLSKGEIYKRYIVSEAKCIFFAPNSFKIKKRPTYLSPMPLKKYEKVHKLRQVELDYNLKKVLKLDFIDKKNIFLMGHSEGGVAASIYKSKSVKARIITAFSCEHSYFYENIKLGSRDDEPFLNIIGTDDEYFARDSILNRDYNVDGHGVLTLQNNINAKIVVLGKTRHDITQNIYVKDEIINFLKLWKNRE